MKRFFVVFILTLVVAGGLTYYMPKDFDCYVEDITSDGVVSIYCRQTELDGIEMGNGRMVQGEVSELQALLAQCQGVDGVSVSFSGSEEDVTRVADLLQLNFTYQYQLDGIEILCGRSAKVKGGVVVDGNKVNVQIAYKDGTVTVGSPLILGSY